uniref:Methyltransferase 5 n=1 Tax=Tanacetum cinerariifolium TaxID=118510 RepID=A0A4V1EKH5_TANCI|nr:methyltransferase 5 [Tanacetum cinerariifolium]
MDVERVFHMNGGLGGNSYAQNSSLQKKASEMVKHITLKCLEETYILMSPNSLGIADLGCSCGQNALSTIREMVETIDETTHKYVNISPREYRVYLNDLSTNDFNAIFKILPDFYKQLNNERQLRGHKFDSSVYIAGYPGTFYGRLFPDKCLHFIYSSYSLHWLSKVPPGLYDMEGHSINKGSFYISKSSSPRVAKAYYDQFQEDFSLFLRSRSKEILVGGRMVLILLGRRDQNHVDRGNSFLWELLSRSFSILVSQGKVKQEKVDEYDAHFYAPSRNELEAEVKKEGSFEMDRFELFDIERKSEGCLSHGTIVARSVRAIQESMISSHFGEAILDDLFENYGKLIDEEMCIEDIRPISFIIVLRKL